MKIFNLKRLKNLFVSSSKKMTKEGEVVLQRPFSTEEETEGIVPTDKDKTKKMSKNKIKKSFKNLTQKIKEKIQGFWKKFTEWFDNLKIEIKKKKEEVIQKIPEYKQERKRKKLVKTPIVRNPSREALVQTKKAKEKKEKEKREKKKKKLNLFGWLFKAKKKKIEKDIKQERKPESSDEVVDINEYLSKEEEENIVDINKALKELPSKVINPTKHHKKISAYIKEQRVPNKRKSLTK